MVKMLLSIAQSDRERKCVCYAIYKASGMTPTVVRRVYGFENMQLRSANVEKAVLEIQNIREAISDLASVEDESLLVRFGIEVQVDSSSDESDEEEELASRDLESFSLSSRDLEYFTAESDEKIVDDHSSILEKEPISMKLLLEKSRYNWFEFYDQLSSLLYKFSNNHSLFDKVMKLGLDADALCLCKQSFLAFLAAEGDAYDQDRTARAVNGQIVSESESDDPDSYVVVIDPLSDAGKVLIARKRVAIQRRAKRRAAKAIAEKRFLSRKVSKKVSKILRDCPDIGKTIENYVQDRQVGADAWMHTGVLMFDGNTHLKNKATYKGIRLHLQIVYKRKVSYGTIVQLCIPRNKCRLSAKRYRGVAKVTSRRARKGFTLKFNPDAHWSCALYKGLNQLQYTDGKDLFILNRDDATGFRLNTLTTCKQYTTPVVEGKEVLTTRTDYVN